MAITLTKTTVGLNLVRNAIAGTDNLKILYVAIGVSSATPLTSNTKLGAEIFRKKVTNYTTSATGEILVNCYIAPGDTVGTNIEEVGIFGGNAASMTVNSGVLLGHGLWVHNPKTNLESITLVFDLVFA